MALRRKKTKKNQAVELLETYLKLKAAQKAAKGAGKVAKGTAVYKVAKKRPVLRFIPLVAGAGVAAAVAAKKLRGNGSPATA